MKKLLMVSLLIAFCLGSVFTGETAQHDLEITNTDANTGPDMRAQINAAVLALGTLQVGATEPSRAAGITYAYMLWADTASGK